ncbi:MAG: DUF3459 domain-containing protein [Acidimicrobiia bacterium]|nr:DUF3459 domain-containing protein [Acidimicrobiia bacterium]
MEQPWWRSAVVCQIYPRSFCDTDGDGVGDLAGVRAHLDHLEWLGIDAIWLSPIFPSPMADFGYDVADYCDVDPLFGSLEEFDQLVEDCHGRGIRVVLDWVPNHSSDQHPWFVESRSALTSEKRDWYVWRNGRDGGPPNNWRSAFDPEAPAWTFDEATGQWYLHLFTPEQPDLEWANPDVRTAMHDTLRFWLDRGVDGFRLDVIHLLGKDPDLPDLPADQASGGVVGSNDHPSSHELIRGIRKVLEEYPGDRMAVGEVYLLSTAKVAAYYGDGDELHLAFNFPPLYAPWNAAAWRKRVDRVVEELDSRDAWPTWVLSNHDNPRHRTRYGSEARARAAAVLLLTLRGTPFLYAGEELGLEDAVIPPERAVDPGGRDGCRAPIPWEPGNDRGWTAAEPWLPWPPEPDARNVATLREDPASIMHLYQRLLAARRASPALQLGSWDALLSPPGTLAYERADGGDRRRVLVNFTPDEHVVPLDGDWTVEVAADGRGEGAAWAGGLGPDAAVVLRPSGP